VMGHEPVGMTEVVSRLRGHPLEQAAKCLVLVVKLDRRTRRHVLAVVPGDSKVDLAAVAGMYAARYAGFADPATAERLARSMPGTVLPFPMDADVELLVDPRVLAQPRLYFNAGRLDRSISLATDDYAAIATPRVAAIAVPDRHATDIRP
jgi:Ala-tRNA(Pro) deacylase